MKTVLVVCLIACSALAQEIVFQGTPHVRAFSTPDNDTREKLDASAGQKNQCVIVRQGKNYLWASRDNARMTRVDGPQFTFFVHASGLGYVKVFTGVRGAATEKAEYIEHINNGWEVVTYWGRSLTTSK
jgi:hypothetical protein